MKYFLGLDIGTTSCGWAVTDENYNLIKIKGKKAWGVRLFDEAQVAADRRTKRTNRRRLSRSKLRISWLNEIFKVKIEKIDKNFLSRLKYSNLYEEDKRYFNNLLESKDSLFHDKLENEKIYSDKDFHKDYPTIYHLRRELTQKPAKDVRFLYLAIHNMLKNRGHFLFEGSFGEDESIKNLYNEFVEFIESIKIEENSLISLDKMSGEIERDVLKVLQQNLGIKQTSIKLNEFLGAKDKQAKCMIKCMIDGKINLKDIFDVQSEENLKLNFSDENYLDQLESLDNLLNEDQFEILSRLQQIYSTVQLKKLLTNHNYVCESMVEKYDVHKSQLKEFKTFIRRYYPEKYNEIFRDSETKKINYPRYVDINKYNHEKHFTVGCETESRTRDDFYKYIRDIISTESQNGDDEYESVKQEILINIENNNFLPKQRTKDNAVIPNKLYEKELKKILDVNSVKFDFLKDVDETGLSNYEKILQIMKFRIPYFVGPVGQNNVKHGWAFRNSDEEIKPWTIDKIIDFDKSEDRFIDRMTNKCTYLYDEDVLPKHSILFEKFKVLNELNNIKFNGKEISNELKQKIFFDLFEKKVKVSTKDLRNYLVNSGIYSKDDAMNLSISGIDREFTNNMATYVKLTTKEFFTKEFVDQNIEIFEKIIKYHTIVSDKNRFEKRIRNEFGEMFSEEQIKYLKSLNYADWGSLSKEFLTMRFGKKDTGEVTTVIDELLNTNQNLQQILFNSNYTIGEVLDKRNKTTKKDLTYDEVNKLYCSPAVKRGVWQTLKLIKEIETHFGELPDKIFVEVTRHDEEKGEKGRKLSRKTNLYSQYTSKEFKDKVKGLSVDLQQLFEELNKQDDLSFRSEKLYLYFLQLGKCMYSGESIELADLFDDNKNVNENKYDVDHIIPQAIIKDDSITNKVLVKKKYNLDKSDSYPIYKNHSDWVNKMKPFWEHLLKLNLINQEKFDRLIRVDFSDADIGNFIARQLVITNQSAKAVTDLLKEVVKDPKDIVYSKAKFVSEFRNKYDIYKSRLANDLHHAKDAYLNIVVGNVLRNRFTIDPKNFYLKDDKNKETTRNINKVFDHTIYSPLSREIIWNGETDVKRIKEIVCKNDCLVTKMSYADTNGKFYDETVYKKGEGLFPLKGDTNNPLSDPTKYGGYNKLKNAYFMVIESIDKKGRVIKTIESLPIIIYQKYKNDENFNEKILEYFEKSNNLKSPKILVDKIYIQSTFKIGKGIYWLGGKTGDNFVLHNANQWRVKNEDLKYIKAIEKYIKLKSENKLGGVEYKEEKIILSKKTKEGNREVALTKQENKNLYDQIIEQLGVNIYGGMQLETGIRQKLVNKRDVFVALSIEDQAKLLYSIMQRVGTGATLANLSLIGEGANSGMITLGKNITNKDISIILTSPSGIYSKEIKL